MIKTNGARIDRRYKDADKAPSIVSEKRLTFFLPDTTFRSLRITSGRCQIQNAEGGEVTLPESPSALVRFCVDAVLNPGSVDATMLEAVQKLARKK